ncbi:MAG: MFS transporter, partial [Steroidobacteraceae bacterium]
GVAAAFAVNIATYIPFIAVLSRWRPPQVTQSLPRETLGIAIATGVRYVAMSPVIHKVLIRSLVFGVGASVVLALLPLVAKVLIAGGPVTYGLLLGAFGVGAVAGAMSAAQLRQRFSTEAIVRFGCCGLAVAAAIVGVSTNLVLTMAALIVAGAGWVLSLATFNVAVQMAAPRWVVARALSLYQMTVFGGLAAGSWLWGVVADQSGVGPALLIAAVVMFVCAVLGFGLPLAQAGELNLDPLSQWKEPVTAVPVEPRTGPVVVTIEYIIHEEDVLEFLTRMAERRRIRRRDGARNWRLLRDLADPHVWVERYETPTWLDYIRLNSRPTHDDAIVPEKIRALHRGATAPCVRRMIERPISSHPAGPASSTESTEI